MKNHKWIFDKMAQMLESGEVPVRTTHNDCKINNVMMDNKTGEVVHGKSVLKKIKQ